MQISRRLYAMMQALPLQEKDLVFKELQILFNRGTISAPQLIVAINAQSPRERAEIADELRVKCSHRLPEEVEALINQLNLLSNPGQVPNSMLGLPGVLSTYLTTTYDNIHHFVNQLNQRRIERPSLSAGEERR